MITLKLQDLGCTTPIDQHMRGDTLNLRIKRRNPENSEMHNNPSSDLTQNGTSFAKFFNVQYENRMFIEMVDYTIDDLDREILRLLQENSRQKNTIIAEKLGYSEGAIRKRISKLVENGVIEKFSIQVKNQVFGSWAVVHVFIGGTSAPSEVRQRIIEQVDGGIDQIFETAGDIDIICVFHTSNEDILKQSIEKIRKVDGVQNTKTYWVLERTKLQSQIYG